MAVERLTIGQVAARYDVSADAVNGGPTVHKSGGVIFPTPFPKPPNNPTRRANFPPAGGAPPGGRGGAAGLGASAVGCGSEPVT